MITKDGDKKSQMIANRANFNRETRRRCGSSSGPGINQRTCRDTEITAQTYYRWRKEFGGLKLDQAKRLKELERENAKLKRLVAELSLEKQILKDVAEGNF